MRYAGLRRRFAPGPPKTAHWVPRSPPPVRRGLGWVSKQARHSSPPPDGMSGDLRARLVAYAAADATEMTPKYTPCGSASTAKRPTSGMSNGSTATWPPSSAACFAVASVSAVPKIAIQ